MVVEETALLLVAVATNQAHVTSTLPLAMAASSPNAPGLTSRSVAAHPTPALMSATLRFIDGRLCHSAVLTSIDDF